MFNLGPDKLILLFVIALIVLGPSKLPDAARNMGRALAEFRRISGNLQAEVREALNDPKDALTAAVADVRQELGGVREGLGDVREGLGGFGLSGGVGASADPTTWTPPVATPPMPVPPSPDDPSLN